MNKEYYDLLNEYNIIVNDALKTLDMMFNQDLLKISLIQFCLNSFVYFKEISKSDLYSINSYVDVDLKFNEIMFLSDKINNGKDTIPFVFLFIKLNNDLHTEIFSSNFYMKIFDLFNNIFKSCLPEGNIDRNSYYVEYLNKIEKYNKENTSNNDDENIKVLYDLYVNYKSAIDLKNIGIDLNETDNTIKKILLELYSYIGLRNVKNEISNLISLIKVRQEREKNGLKNPTITYHLCFLGNPGTGKTTVARLVGKLYKQLGILESGHLIEVARQDLVGQYIGHTAIKTKEVIDKAKGGILFIDEAYTLSNKTINDFGPEAIEVILKEMEDNRDNLVVIVAGYNSLMEEFLNSNPGLKSRFNSFIHFDDYNAKELVEIMKLICEQNDYFITKETENDLEKYFSNIIKSKDSNFSNGRYVRNMFENAIKIQSKRLTQHAKIDKNDLKQLVFNDFIGKENE